MGSRIQVASTSQVAELRGSYVESSALLLYIALDQESLVCL